MRFNHFLSVATVLAFAAPAMAQPVVDGVINSSEGYTVPSNGTRVGAGQFGNEQCVSRVYVHDGPSTITIAVEGNSSYNNHFTIYGNILGRTGAGTGTVPSTPSAGAISSHTGMVLPMSDIDFAISANSGDNNNGSNAGGNDASFYVDFAAYGPQAVQFLGTDAVNDQQRDTSSVTGSITYNSAPRAITFGYSDLNFSGTPVTTGTQTDGFEIALPKAMFGTITSANSLELFVMMGSGGGFVAGGTIPTITGSISGGNSPNFGNGNNVNFTAGTANGGTFTALTAATTAVQLPVSMSEFAVE
jgi:hypothetical protein